MWSSASCSCALLKLVGYLDLDPGNISPIFWDRSTAGHYFCSVFNRHFHLRPFPLVRQKEKRAACKYWNDSVVVSVVQGIADGKVTHPPAQMLIQQGGRTTLAKKPNPYFFKVKSIEVAVVSARCGLLCSIYSHSRSDNTAYPLAIFQSTSQQRSKRAGMCVHRFVVLPLFL